MTRGRRRSSPHAAAGGLESLLDALAPEDSGDVGLARLQRAWPAAVGPGIAGAGRPVAFVDGVLHVACADATWAHELQLLQAELVRRLHGAGMTDVVAVRARAGGGSSPGGPPGRTRGRTSPSPTDGPSRPPRRGG